MVCRIDLGAKGLCTGDEGAFAFDVLAEIGYNYRRFV